MTQTVQIAHRPELNRFDTTVEGHLCRLDYRMQAQVMAIHHTEVAPSLEGRGIAAALVQAAVTHAQETGLRIRPLCSYVSAWMRRHPEHAGLLG